MKVMKKYFLLIILIVLIASNAFAEPVVSKNPSTTSDIYEYMEEILQGEEGHNCILDADIVVYASRLYFEKRHIDSIQILKKVHLDHDSIYWLWKNEIALCDELVLLESSSEKYRLYMEYIENNKSYFIFDENLKRHFPSNKRREESMGVYPNNEFLPEMNIYYHNLEVVRKLRLKNKANQH